MKNVILLTIDALRKDVLGCYGNKDGLTPFIDSLKDQCIRFTNAQSIGPYTQASLPGLLTSAYYLEYGYSEELPSERVLISEPLQKAGIVTAAFHSNLYASDLLGWNRGWDIFYDSIDEEVSPMTPYVRGNTLNRTIARWLSSNTWDGDKRLFLWVHYMDVHEPYIPDRKYIDLVEPSLNMSPEEMFELFRGVLVKRDISNPAKIKILKQLYDIHVIEVDTYVEEFFGILKKTGLLQDATLIISSDHGDEFGEHGGLSHDDKMYGELINIPLLIYNPNRNKETVCHTVVSGVDIPPTIVHVFGLKPVAGFEGHSLLPLEGYPQKGVFGEAIYQLSPSRGDKGRGGDLARDIYYYREENLKIIYRANLDSWEMYDLKEDPGELNNVVDTSPLAKELKSKLRPRVRRWMR